MPRYNVPLTTWANCTATVETDETDPEKIAELATEQVRASLCHQCAGTDSLEIGDEWNPSVDDNGKPEIYPLDGGK